MVSVFALLSFALHSFGAGLIIVHDSDFWRPGPPRVIPPPHIPPLHHRPWAALEVASVKAEVKIKDQIAQTSIDQEFYNPNSQQLEGTFLFPVPKGAQIDKFTMEINGKQVEAELLAADKARGIYEDIVRKTKDPALLEYAGRDLFKVRIFPIEAHAKKRITLAYTQVLKLDSGLANYILPLNTEKYSAKPVKSLSLKVDLEMRRPLKSIYSPSHNAQIKRHGDNRAVVGFETTDSEPDTDFQLFFSTENSEVGLDLLTYKTKDGDGYFMLLASPGFGSRKTKVIPKDVLFVLDTSGSMAGAKLEQAKKALLFCVENLNENDRFEIIRFATDVENIFEKLVDADGQNRERARKFIKDFKPTGGTAINDALQKAVAMRPDSGQRPFVIIFLTDGLPTVGVTDESSIVSNMTKCDSGKTRIFCFGIGTDVNTHLLDKIAEHTKAFSQYVLADEDLEVKLSNFFSKIREPILANPKITFPSSVRVTKVYPSPLPDLFRGEQIVLAGRYSGSGSGAITIEGDVSGETRKFAEDVKFPDTSSEHEFIPRLWAMRRVGYLLDEIRLRGDNKELKDEVSELARKFGIVTPYTAYLILEDESARNVPLSMQSLRLRENPVEQRQELAYYYEQVTRDKDGAGAVGSARSLYSLKAADSAEALSQGQSEAVRGGVSGPAARRPAALAGKPLAELDLKKEVATRTQEFAQQSRFAAGRTFFQNTNQWIDAEIQKRQSAQRKRVQFNSDEYFALVRKDPRVPMWVALGQNVQFVLGETVYEIHE
jgi:Ca-activated chloride channel homolog